MPGALSDAAKLAVDQRSRFDVRARYDLDARAMASGASGKVFSAKDRKSNGRRVAIKKSKMSYKEALKNEANIVKELDHPNICKLLETYEESGTVYLVMDMCEGGDLYDHIRRVRWIEEPTAADVLRQVASALLYAHGRGIAHRDVKPENVCFCTNDPDDNDVKVIDWGAAFHFRRASMTSMCGSLKYVAPEVFRGQGATVYTAACDVWSLGVLAYASLCGVLPFRDEDIWSGQLELVNSNQWTRISADARGFVLSLLKIHPERRLPLEFVLAHPWLRVGGRTVDKAITSQVLMNLRSFSNASQSSMFIFARFARQLDHRSLRSAQRVFRELDSNGDGTLDLNEVRTGFERIFGKGIGELTEMAELMDIAELFARLDLDQSGAVDYTEFCAAAIAEPASTEEHLLWAAYEAFEVQDDAEVGKQEVAQVLLSADANKVGSDRACSTSMATTPSTSASGASPREDFEEEPLKVVEGFSRARDTSE